MATNYAGLSPQDSDTLDQLNAQGQPFDATVGPDGKLQVNKREPAFSLDQFNWNAARQDGFSDREILDGLFSSGVLGFDLKAARADGYSDEDIVNFYAKKPEPAKAPEQSAWRRAADVGISAVKSAIAVPEAVVGLADIPTMGYAGKAAEAIGFRPKEAKAALDDLLSDKQKAANKAVEDAKGFFPTIGAALQNPSVIGHSVIESAGLMGAGGVVGRGLSALVSPVTAAAMGEGVVGAGAAAEQIRQETKDGLLTPFQGAAAIGSGIGTSVFGAIGGKLSHRLGITDVDTYLATGKIGETNKGIIRRIVEGGISEGVFEELPQSVQEQMWQNAALNRPLMQGVPEGAAMGLLAGAAMGGGFGILSGPQRATPEADPTKLADQETQVTDPIKSAGPILAAPDVDTAIAEAFKSAGIRDLQDQAIALDGGDNASELVSGNTPASQGTPAIQAAGNSVPQTPDAVQNAAENLPAVDAAARTDVANAAPDVAQKAGNDDISARRGAAGDILTAANSGVSSADGQPSIQRGESQTGSGPDAGARSAGPASSGKPGPVSDQAIPNNSRADTNGSQAAAVELGSVGQGATQPAGNQPAGARTPGQVNGQPSSTPPTNDPAGVQQNGLGADGARGRAGPRTSTQDTQYSNNRGAAVSGSPQPARAGTDTERVAANPPGNAGASVPNVPGNAPALPASQRQPVPASGANQSERPATAKSVWTPQQELKLSSALKKATDLARKAKTAEDSDTALAANDVAEALLDEKAAATGIARPAREESPFLPGDITRENGTLFANKDLAENYKKRNGIAKTASPVEIVEGGKFVGYAIRKKPLTKGQEIARAQQAEAARTVYPSRDNLYTAMAKLGGMTRSDTPASWGTDLKDKLVGNVFGANNQVLTHAGLSIDEMGQRLAELGYLPTDENGKYDEADFAEAFRNGDNHYTPSGQERNARLSQEAKDLEAQRQAMALPEDALDEFDQLARESQGRVQSTWDSFDDELGAKIHGQDALDELTQEQNDEIDRLAETDAQDSQGSTADAAENKGEVQRPEPAGKSGSPEGNTDEAGQGTRSEVAASGASAVAPVERFEIGRSLTKEQRKATLESLTDAYKEAGHRKEQRIDSRGEEYWAYPHAPELFRKSDITGQMVRYYVHLPDGRIAHPSELFPNYTNNDIKNELARQKTARDTNRSVVKSDYARPAVQFDSTQDAAKWWDARSDQSLRENGHHRTIYSSLERTILTNGSKFIMVPDGVMKNAGMVEALAEEGWKRKENAAPANTSPERVKETAESAQVEPSAQYYYLDGNKGMASSGSFTADKSRWITFSASEAKRMVDGDIKPYGATRLGLFVGTENNQRLTKDLTNKPAQVETPVNTPVEAPVQSGVLVPGMSDGKMAQLRSASEPALDIDRKPNGWLLFRGNDEVALVHPDKNEVRRFDYPANSGTGRQRAIVYASAFAQDNPIAAKELPKGELEIQPIFNRPAAPIASQPESNTEANPLIAAADRMTAAAERMASAAESFLQNQTPADLAAKKAQDESKAAEEKRIADLERDQPLTLQGQDVSADRIEAEKKRAQGTMFSRKVADEKDLIVQHNLTAANLYNVDRMGGMAVPSLAITKASSPLENFGEITLIGPTEMADPKGYANTRVFGADIYSPRYPQVHYRFTDNTLSNLGRQLSDGIKATESKIDVDELERNGAEGLEKQPAAMYQFLQQEGIEPKVIRDDGPTPKAMAALKKAGLLEYAPKKGEYFDKFPLQNDPEFQRLAYEENRRVYKDAGLPKEGSFDSLDDGTKRNIARTYADTLAGLANIGQVIKYRTTDEMRNQIYKANLGDKFAEYAQDLFDSMNAQGRIFKGFNYAGNRSYTPHNLENVVKILKKELRGGENFNYGAGSLRARFTPQFRSLAEIKKNKERLVSKEDFDAVKTEVDGELVELAGKLSPFYGGDSNRFGYLDAVVEMLGDSAKMGMSRALTENLFTEVDAEVIAEARDFLGKLRNLPTEYFEAKILRSVSLPEFAAAVIPTDAPQKARKILEKNGIQVFEYKPNDIASRTAAVKKAAASKSAMFSRQPKQAQSIQASDARAATEVITKKWKNAPKITVHESLTSDSVPAGLRSAMEKEGVTDARGAWYAGEIHLFPSNIGSLAELERTIVHEARHYGLEGLFGKDMNPILMEIYMKDKGVRTEANRLVKTLKVSTVDAVNETLANMPLDAAKKLPGWQKLIAKLKAWLNDRGFTNLAKMLEGPSADAITKDILYQVEQFVKTGKRGDTTFTTTLFSRDNVRSWLPNVRGGWTEEKIRKVLKAFGGKNSSGKIVQRIIAQYDNATDFADHIFYHGTGGYVSGSLKPSITMSERDAERRGGGGYGERYWAVSLSKNKNIASNFTGQSASGSVYPVMLKKGAKVIDMPEISDSQELEDHIVRLWNEGVDAVRIGDWNNTNDEQELSVLNPAAIFKYENADYFRVFQMKRFESLTPEQIEKIYADAVKTIPFLDSIRGMPKDQWQQEFSKLDRVQFSRKESNKRTINPNEFPTNEENRQYTDRLEKALRQGGDNFTATPVLPQSEANDAGERGDNAGAGDRNIFRLAEKVAGVFGKQVVWIRADGDFSINGVMTPRIPNKIFIDVRAKAPVYAVMGHELAHWIEFDAPATYAQLMRAMDKVLIRHEQYRVRNGLPFNYSKDQISKEMVGDLMGDAFATPQFWKNLAQENPGLIRGIANKIMQWLNNAIAKFSKGFGSEAYVNDLKVARHALAQAVAEYALLKKGATATDATGEYSKAYSDPGDPQFHRAFHGTPHDFDQFTTNAMGTGEGAQAYGWGLYFAGNQAVADYYRKELSQRRLTESSVVSAIAARKPAPKTSSAHKLIAMMQKMNSLNADDIKSAGLEPENFGIQEADGEVSVRSIAYFHNYGADDYLREVSVSGGKKYNAFTFRDGSMIVDDGSEASAIEAPNGKLYEVELAPKQEDYLDWDKPLSEQSEEVRQALRDGIASMQDDADRKYMERATKNDEAVGGFIYKAVVSMYSDGGNGTNSRNPAMQQASQFLKSIGIPGIKYLDGSSRSKGEGNHNFVIFDDKDVSIVAKYSRTDQTESPAFKRWFGNSAVVDSNGKPLIVYHGTRADFAEFKTRRSKPDNRMGSYFTPNADGATKTGGGQSVIMPVYLAIENPLDLRGVAREELAERAGLTAASLETRTQGRAGEYATLEYLDRKHDLIPKLKKRGYDGLIFSDEIDGDTFVVFRPEQIKSAIGNNGDFDGTNPDIRYSRTAADAPKKWDAPEPSKMDSILYKLQDKQIDLKRVTEAVRDGIGEILETWDAYLKETLFHGRSAKRVATFAQKELKPLLNDMQLRGVTIPELETYLHNRHAEERNKQVAKINPKLPDRGSGIYTKDARAYLAGLTTEQRTKYEALAKKVDAITKGTRQTLQDYGLMSNAEMAQWEGAYKHYVPLMKDTEVTGQGEGFSIRGDESKRALGDGAIDSNILANLMAQRERAIVRGEKNRVALSLYGLAKLNPNEDFWSVDNPPIIRRVVKLSDKIDRRTIPLGMDIPENATEVVVEGPDPMFLSRENVIVTKYYNPKTDTVTEKAIVFNEDNPRAVRMAAALKNLDADQMGEIMNVMAKATRFLASVNTQYNPIFGLVNLTRDLQGAVLNLTSTELAGKQKQVLAGTLAALKAVYLTERGGRKGREPKGEWGKLYDEFQNVGAQTGYRDLFTSSQDRADALQREINKITEGKVKQAGRAIFDWLSDYNQAMENSVRLAAYKVGLDQGLSKEAAANVAKNLTVNFNRKGQITQQAGALYAFFNASVQGTARLAQTLKGPAGKRILIGGLILGALQAMMLAGFDEDEPPQFERERNLIIPIGGKDYFKIPMPLGLHVIPNISRILIEMGIHGKPMERLFQLMSVTVDAFNPVGAVGLSAQTFTPTVADPFVALGENRDWTGKPIAREDFSSLNPTPGHSRSKDTASIISKTLSEGLNWASGGTEYTKGKLSPTPDQLDYLFGQVGGGVWREGSKFQQSISSAFTGEELPPYKIPVIGRFYGSTGSQASKSALFYRNLKQLNAHEAEIEGRQKAGQDPSDYIRDNPDSELYQAANRIEREISKRMKQKRQMVKDNAPKSEVKDLENEMAELMHEFNQEVSARRGKRSSQ